MAFDLPHSWRRLFRLPRANPRAAVDDEIAFHVAMRIDDYVARGMSPEEARRRVLEQFGMIKSQATSDLVQAIRMVHEGRIYLSPGISQAVVEACTKPDEDPAPPLTPREQQVLQLVAEGKSTKEAARILNISVKTAESHRTRVMAKLDVHDTASLVRYAIREGFIQA